MKIALGVEYDGTHYFGFQRLPNTPTVQETLEKALSKIADHPIELVCAGRTDAGVHAYEQVIHIHSTAQRHPNAWTLGVNQHLPPDIRVLWAKPMDENFHARFSAKSRRYHYKILNRSIASPLLQNRMLHHRHALDEKLMHEAAQVLIGEHDFTSFRASQCQARHPIREIFSIHISRENDHLLIDIHANAFLHHMVRNIVGSLLMVGDGREPPSFIAEALYAKDRRKAGPTAPPHGLYFHSVSYE
jgi:tRNA pseudouridine38-40 synthase